MTTQRTNLRDELESLWQRAHTIWLDRENDPSFGAYVSADFSSVLDALVRLSAEADTFLEWGSGLGVVAIMADKLGLESYGIEMEPELVELSRDLAEEYDSSAEFAVGGFIPDHFQWRPELGEEAVRTSIDVADGYGDLGMELTDFDLIYGYPWPTEHELFKGVMRSCGSPHSKLLVYDAREGVAVYTNKDWE